ncbi:hypothetical protein Csa_019753 [Cucumis sativus]|uniref:Uncharacterized protein n=1 Tax=Cucumis sativus TaxID=3659 RepID=A0A0A0LZ02_CUCSA|nr:hypothetical protein Csa_019753 [Cucumis sativus]
MEKMGGVGSRVFDGSLSLQSFLIERRPYHRNCGCALHDDRIRNGAACSHALKSKNSVSFLKTQKCPKTSLQILPSSSRQFVNSESPPPPLHFVYQFSTSS